MKTITITWFEKGDCLLDGLMQNQVEVMEEGLPRLWDYLQGLRDPLEGWFANVQFTLRREDEETKEIYLSCRDQIPEKGNNPPPAVVAVVKEINQFFKEEVAYL